MDELLAVSAPVIAFFNNKGGVGGTSLVYHVAWMMTRMGLRVVAADFDPQANLTANFLDEERLESLLPAGDALTTPGKTVYGSLVPLIQGVGDLTAPPLVDVTDQLFVLPGDLALSNFEDELSDQWPACLDGKERAFRVISAFWRLIGLAEEIAQADVVLVDVGPNLGAINRSALIAADHVVIPLAPDMFSAQGLQNLAHRLHTWRVEWHERISRNPASDLPLPSGDMHPVGYVLLGDGVRLGRPVQAYERWMARIPTVYRTAVLGVDETAPAIENDPYCLARLRHYRSLMPLSYDAHKPVFDLKPADGAFGGHQAAVVAARADFVALTGRILREVGVPVTAAG
jgi:cellulose biosynthesis protein BcsQ